MPQRQNSRQALTKCHSRVEPSIYLVVSFNPNFVFGQDRFAEPSREDYFDFLVRCYFGEGKNLLLLCVQRAYLDLNRTLHGFASHSGAEGLRKQAHQCLATSVIKLKKIESSERRFDLWHRKTCSEVRELYRAWAFGQRRAWHLCAPTHTPGTALRKFQHARSGC